MRRSSALWAATAPARVWVSCSIRLASSACGDGLSSAVDQAASRSAQPADQRQDHRRAAQQPAPHSVDGQGGQPQRQRQDADAAVNVVGGHPARVDERARVADRGAQPVAERAGDRLVGLGDLLSRPRADHGPLRAGDPADQQHGLGQQPDAEHGDRADRGDQQHGDEREGERGQPDGQGEVHRGPPCSPHRLPHAIRLSALRAPARETAAPR